jgi:hypothetical protein
MTIQSDEDLFFETKPPCGITIRIKKDKYWLLKRSLFYSAYLFAILVNWYLLVDNLNSCLFWLLVIVLIFYYIEKRLPLSPKEWEKLIKSLKNYERKNYFKN